jgi:hypothetical protein
LANRVKSVSFSSMGIVKTIFLDLNVCKYIRRFARSSGCPGKKFNYIWIKCTIVYFF